MVIKGKMGVGGRLNAKGHRIWGGEMFYMLTWMAVIKMYTFVKSIQLICVKYFITCKYYLNKDDFKKMWLGKLLGKRVLM